MSEPWWASKRGRDEVRRIVRQQPVPAHRVVQREVIDWANSLNGKPPTGEDLKRLIYSLAASVKADRVSNDQLHRTTGHM